MPRKCSSLGAISKKKQDNPLNPLNWKVRVNAHSKIGFALQRIFRQWLTSIYYFDLLTELDPWSCFEAKGKQFQNI